MGSKFKIQRPSDDMDAMLPFMSLLLIIIPLLIGNVAFFHFKSIEVTIPGVSDPATTPPEPPTPNAEKKVTARLLIESRLMQFDLLDEETAEPIEKVTGPVTSEKAKEFFEKLKNFKNTYPKLETLMVNVYERVLYEQLATVLEVLRSPIDISEVNLDESARTLAEKQGNKFKFNIVMLPRTKEEELKE